MDTTRQRQTTSYAGMTRIRFEGLRSVPHSQPVGSPVVSDVNTTRTAPSPTGGSSGAHRAGGPYIGSMATARDWELVRRVVAALPEGTWTSYGDLAELIGTGPRQVGAYMRDGDVPRAYRVLTASGKVSEGFRWSDGRTGRDVPELLREDGVRVDRSGRADRSGRMYVYDLRLLAMELAD